MVVEVYQCNKGNVMKMNLLRLVFLALCAVSTWATMNPQTINGTDGPSVYRVPAPVAATVGQVATRKVPDRFEPGLDALVRAALQKPGAWIIAPTTFHNFGGRK